MMIGELDFEDNFLLQPSKVDYGQVSTQLALFLFVLVGNIVIANLLIGLTVSKTGEMFKKAGLVKLEKTVNQVCIIDKVFKMKNQFPCSKRLGEKTKIFKFLSSLSSKKDKQNTHWKVYVMPHSIEQIQMNSKGRQFLDSQVNFDTSSTSFDKSYFAYLFDDENCPVEEKLPFTLPSWIIAHTLTMLRDRQLKNNIRDARDMETSGDITVKELRELLGNETNNETTEGKNMKVSDEKLDKKQRKVSVAPALEKVPEEKFTTNENLKALEEKIHSMESSLQELKELLKNIHKTD